MVNVKLRALGTLKQHVFPTMQRIVYQYGNIINKGRQALCIVLKLSINVLGIKWIGIQQLSQIKILFFYIILEFFSKERGIKKVGHLDSVPDYLVIITRSYTPSRGPELFSLGLGGLSGKIQGLVIRHYQMRV